MNNAYKAFRTVPIQTVSVLCKHVRLRAFMCDVYRHTHTLPWGAGLSVRVADTASCLPVIASVLRKEHRTLAQRTGFQARKPTAQPRPQGMRRLMVHGVSKVRCGSKRDGPMSLVCVLQRAQMRPGLWGQKRGWIRGLRTATPGQRGRRSHGGQRLWWGRRW